MAITVDIPGDERDFDIDQDDVSLRDAILEADPGETINFAASLNGATISLAQGLGEIAFEKSLTIDASMLPAGITIDAGASDLSPDPFDGIRLFNITDPTSGSNPPLVTMIGLTLTGGDVAGDGGAIRTEAKLNLRDCTITGNQAFGSGGGVAAFFVAPLPSSLTIRKSIVSDNTAGLSGGGVFATITTANLSNPTVAPEFTIAQSLISGNTAFRRGGGLYTHNLEGTETLVEECRVTGNHVLSGGFLQRNGGGIYAYVVGNAAGTNKPKFTITRSTVDDNDAVKDGGGIFACGKGSGDFVATNVTVSGNGR